MKKEICFALCTVLLAAPATARALDWEVKDVTHTITATVGENSFTMDGEEIPLPEGMEVYKKDGYVMLPAEPLLEALDKESRTSAAVWEREETALLLYMKNNIISLDLQKNIVQTSGAEIKLTGSPEIREEQLYLSLRSWKDILVLYGYAADGNAIGWDNGTQTATLRISEQELDIEELPKQTPAGKGSEPEYILKPTRKYERITNMGDGYFSAEIGSVSTKEDILNSAGKVIQTYESGVHAYYLGENRFMVTDYNKNKEEDRKKVVDESGKAIFSLEGRKGMKWFSEGLAEVSLGNGAGFGFVDVNGEMVIPAKFGETEPFSEGLAAVCLESRESRAQNGTELWGYIDKKGRLVVPAKYERCEPFREGLAAVKSGGKWGYIDKTGQEVIPLQYDWASYFYNGTAFVEEKDEGQNINTWVIDKTGKKQKQVTEGKRLYYVEADYPELYPGVMRSEEIVKYTGDHGHMASYYDAKGEISDKKMEWITGNSEGLMAFQDEETGKYGYVDEGYNWVIAPVFDHAEDFEDSYAVVYNKTKQGTATIDSEWGIIRRPENLPLQ